jgi:hypothetical protein
MCWTGTNSRALTGGRRTGVRRGQLDLNAGALLDALPPVIWLIGTLCRSVIKGTGVSMALVRSGLSGIQEPHRTSRQNLSFRIQLEYA